MAWATPATGTEAPGLCLARTRNPSLLSLSGHFSSLLPRTASLDLFKNHFFPALYVHRKLQQALQVKALGEER